MSVWLVAITFAATGEPVANMLHLDVQRWVYEGRILLIHTLERARVHQPEANIIHIANEHHGCAVQQDIVVNIRVHDKIVGVNSKPKGHEQLQEQQDVKHKGVKETDACNWLPNVVSLIGHSHHHQPNAIVAVVLLLAPWDLIDEFQH